MYRVSVQRISSSIAAVTGRIHHGNVLAMIDPHFLRPMQPFEIGERVQVSVKEQANMSKASWFDGVIVDIDSTRQGPLSVHDGVIINIDSTRKGSFSVQLEKNKEVLRNIRPHDIRRFDTKQFKVGDRTYVLDGEESCEGTILHAYRKGTFLVRCLDGAVKTKVPSIMLQQIKSHESC